MPWVLQPVHFCFECTQWRLLLTFIKWETHVWNLALRFILENSFPHSTFFRSCIVGGSQSYFLKNNNTKNVFYTKVVLFLFISEKSVNTFTKDTTEIVYHVIRVGVLCCGFGFYFFYASHSPYLIWVRSIQKQSVLTE